MYSSFSFLVSRFFFKYLSDLSSSLSTIDTNFIIMSSLSLENFFVIIIIYSFEFFTSALADGFLLESEWLQVSSSLKESSQYSGYYQ